MRFPFPADEIVEPLETATAVSTIVEPLEVIPKDCSIPEATTGDNHAIELPQSVTSEPVKELVAEDELVSGQTAVLELEPAPEPVLEPWVDTVPRPRPKRKVIAFPRHLSAAPETIYRLADPVTTEVPRILDVPEELEAIPTTPYLDGLQFDPAEPAGAMRDREHVELPFQAVRVSRRVFAGLVDLAVTGAGVAVFAGVAFKILSTPPLSKPLILGLVASAGLLWSVYQYLFVVYAGQTLGMIAVGIRLRTFKGRPPNFRQRRHRVLSFCLSALSLGMGLMWVFVDVDALCWHDRLSQTYLSDRT